MLAIGPQLSESVADKAEVSSGSDAQAECRACFLITVDTECDDAWSPTKEVTTANAEYLPRFQALCESHGLTPTYFTTYEMASSPAFQEFGRDALRRGTAEIGMHLHAWNSLPLVALTSNDSQYHPYLIEYPEPVMRDKVNFMTDLLEETFRVKMTSHRAGRWGFNEFYARLLVDRGYLADCSVTPLISWAEHPGDPEQSGGPDYSAFPLLPYFLDLEDISRPGKSNLLEIPVTAMDMQPRLLKNLSRRLARRSLLRRAINRLCPAACWLAPTPENIGLLLRVLKKSISTKRPCIQFALHSSNLMPGGSPSFPTKDAVERLYDDLNMLFTLASQNLSGSTVTAFRRQFAEASSAAPV
jgi:hypothetical protein